MNFAKSINYLLNNIHEYEGNYGFVYSALIKKENTDKEIKNILEKSMNSNHSEFVVLGLQLLSKKNPENKEINKTINKIKLSKNKTTNWTLLRSLININNNKITKGLRISKQILKKRQNKEGLIMDFQGEKSFQYHCFSTALSLMIYEKTKDKELLNIITNAINFIQQYILPNGMSLYVGRGQEQIFGYGALINILSNNKNKELREKLKKVKKYVESFQREDGSIPLVLSQEEKKLKESGTHLAGWYSYNTLEDYLPFFLWISNHEINNKILTNIKIQHTKSDEFSYFEDDNKIAIFSRPTSSQSSSIPYPLIFDKKQNKITTPLYGGEEYMASCHHKSDIPLPYGKIKNEWMYFQDMNFTIRTNKLFGKNKFANFTRIYNPKTNKLQDNIIWKKEILFEVIYLKNKPLNEENQLFRKSNEITPEEINRFVNNGTTDQIELEIK